MKTLGSCVSLSDILSRSPLQKAEGTLSLIKVKIQFRALLPLAGLDAECISPGTPGRKFRAGLLLSAPWDALVTRPLPDPAQGAFPG